MTTKVIPFLALLTAPLSAIAGLLTLHGDGSYDLSHGSASISHHWRSAVPLEFDKKLVLDRTKKESCSGGECESFELLTEVTPHDLGGGNVLMDVEFTNTSGDDVTRLTGSLVAGIKDSAKLELKSEDKGGDHFKIHLFPRERPERPHVK